MNSKDFKAMMTDAERASEKIIGVLQQGGLDSFQMRFDSDPNGTDHYITVSFRVTDVVREMIDNDRGFSETYKVEEGKTVVLQAKSREELIDMRQKIVKTPKDDDSAVEVEFSAEELA